MSISPQKHATRNAIVGTFAGLIIVYFACPLLFSMPFVLAWRVGVLSVDQALDAHIIVRKPAYSFAAPGSPYYGLVTFEEDHEPTGIYSAFEAAWQAGRIEATCGLLPAPTPPIPASA